MTRIGLYRMKRPAKGRPKRAVWVLRWHDGNGKWCCDTIGVVGEMTKREAEKIRRDRQGKMDNRIIPTDRPQKMTLAELTERDREKLAVSTFKPSTRLEYDHTAAHAKAALGADIEVSRIDGRAVDRVKKHLLDQGLRDATVRKTIRALAAMFARATKSKLIHDNPFAGEAEGQTQRASVGSSLPMKSGP